MSKSSYNERQIEVENILRSNNVPSAVIDEIVSMIDAEPALKALGESAWREKANAETLLRIKIAEEGDWRKKASLTAMLISRSFD